jgi:hypothetical protein
MFCKPAIKALGLAALCFSQGSLANPVAEAVAPGPFGQINRHAKAQSPSIKTDEQPVVQKAPAGTAATTFRYLNSQTSRKW